MADSSHILFSTQHQLIILLPKATPPLHISEMVTSRAVEIKLVCLLRRSHQSVRPIHRTSIHNTRLIGWLIFCIIYDYGMRSGCTQTSPRLLAAAIVVFQAHPYTSGTRHGSVHYPSIDACIYLRYTAWKRTLLVNRCMHIPQVHGMEAYTTRQ